MLGLKRGTVKLVPYDPQWATLFAAEERLLRETFGDFILAVVHIGSTAIPGIPAKPIIDINVGVASLEVARAMKSAFARLGYEHRPYVAGQTKADLQWQELYVKGPEENRTHHVHVTVFGSRYWMNDLLFRDYLLRHEQRARQYANLKAELATQHVSDRARYTQGKEQFIRETLEMARSGESNSSLS